MVHAVYECSVAASFEAIWAQLVKKVRHPEGFVKGVSDVEIVEDGDGRSKPVYRRMHLGPQVIEENIFWSHDEKKGVVDFRRLDADPVFSGNVLNVVERTESPATCILRFELNWEPKPGAPASATALDMSGAIKAATELTRDVCEAASTT